MSFRRLLTLFLAVLFLGVSVGADAASFDSEKKVPVKGYYKKNGTYVHPHTRETGGSHKKASKKKSEPAYKAPAPSSSGTVKRDKDGKIKRSQGAKNAFRKNHPCPATGKTSGKCPGYEVDHVIPLACGGADDPSNMQWLTKEKNRKKGAMGCERR